MNIKAISGEQNNNYTAAENTGRQMERSLILSALEYPAIQIVEGGSCACQGRMKRAIVGLSADISGGMQYMSTVVKGSAYNPDIRCMAFCVDGMNVIVEPHTMTIHKVKDEVEAMAVIEWLKDSITLT